MLARTARFARVDLREYLTEALGRIPAAVRRHVVLAHDLMAVYLSCLIAVCLRFGQLDLAQDGVAQAHGFTPLLLVLFLATSSYYRMHHGVWRFASLPDLLTILKVVTITIGAFYLALFLLQRLEAVPRSLPLIQWIVLVFLLGGARFGYRLLRGDAAAVWTACGAGDQGTPVLLLGNGAGTSFFIRAARRTPDNPYRVVGILAPAGGRAHRGRHIHHVPVLGEFDELGDVVARLDASGQRPTRLVVTERLAPDVMQSLVEHANALRAIVCRMPEPVEFKTPDVEGAIELRPVALEDLLERPQVVLDEAAIDGLVAGRRVLVTGAGGSIGGELVRQIAARGPAELVLLDHAEYNLYSIDHEVGHSFPDVPRRAVLCDVRRRARVMALMAEHRPELVFHAAALKHVPMVELNPCEGVFTNAIGTRNLADACLRHGARAMVQVSTDKAVNPTNVMGASKRLAEFYCQALDLAAGGAAPGQPRPRFMTVRFGNVLGSSGSVVPLFQQQLARGGPLTVTHPEIERYFMTIPEAVSLVLHASAHGTARDDERGQIMVLDMGEPVRVLDIARKLIRLAGREPGTEVPIVFTGLRPGEKLFEELFDDAERRVRASIGGVFAALSRPIRLERLEAVFGEVEAACARGDEVALRRLIAGIIPGYAAPDEIRPSAAA